MTTNPTPKVRRLVFGAVSIAICLHLIAIFLLPNGGAVESRALAPLIVPYANTLNLNTPWVFFSPGPAPNFYIEYELEKAEGESLEEAPRVYPPPKANRFYSESNFRSLYSLRYFALHPTRLGEFFAPWLCRQHPEASSIVVQPVFEQVSGIDRAWLADSFGDILERTDFARQRFHCKDETASPSDSAAEESKSKSAPAPVEPLSTDDPNLREGD